MSIRWYSKTGTLTIKGEKAIELKNKFLNIEREIPSKGKLNSNYQCEKDLHSNFETTDTYLHNKSPNCKQNALHFENMTFDETNPMINNIAERNEIKSMLERFPDNVNRKLAILEEEML